MPVTSAGSADAAADRRRRRAGPRDDDRRRWVTDGRTDGRTLTSMLQLVEPRGPIRTRTALPASCDVSFIIAALYKSCYSTA